MVHLAYAKSFSSSESACILELRYRCTASDGNNSFSIFKSVSRIGVL